VDVHNSVKEVGDMAKDFLVLFSQSSVPADQVVHNFLDGCGAGGTGRRDELNQTIDNRKNFTITAWKVGEPRVAINFAGRCTFRSRSADACTAVDVDWSSTCKVQDPTAGCSAVGATRHDVGIDWVTAIYQAPTKRWWLCDSDFDTLFSSSLKPFRK
jgi:hypothetical protein